MRTLEINLGAIAVVLLMVACNGEHMRVLDESDRDVSGTTGNGSVTYDGQIEALFNRRCAYCHNAGSSLPNWLDYETAFQYRNQIFQRVVVDKTMPKAPYDKMTTDAERKMVADWINTNAPKAPATGGPPGGVAPGGADLALYRQIQPIFGQRCSMCHNESSPVPNWMDYNTAVQYRSEVYQRVFVDRSMPPGNATGLTDDERTHIGNWANGSGSAGSSNPPIGPCHQETGAALAAAASSGDVDEVTRLLDDGACPDGVDANGMSALMAMLARPADGECGPDFAAITHELLMIGKADVNVSFGGGSALDWAVARDCTEVARILIENDAAVNTQVGAGADPYLAKWQGYTPLMLAIRNSDFGLARSLLAHGADANVKLTDGTTALGLAQRVQSPAKRDALVALLKKYVPDTPAAPGVSLSYAKDTLPIFKDRCSVCHNASTPERNWLNYDTAFKNREKIFGRVVTLKDMPLGNATKMTDDERSEVSQWIQAGAPQ